MKSLEHLIREIREGKAEKSEKKTLESSIRNVMSKESSYAAKDSKPVDEHCGCEEEKKKKVSKEDGDKLPGAEDKMDEAIGTLGTDKYQGTEFKSIRTATPHIQPPKGDETHSQAPENASRLRSVAKEKAGINRVTEGLAAKALPYLDDLARAITKAPKPKAGAAPKIKPIEPEPIAPKPNIPDSTPPTKVPPSEVPKPANDPVPTPKPSEKPAVTPAQPSVKPSTKPQIAPAPAVEPAPATKPQVAPAPAVEPAPATKPQVAVKPATNPKAATSPEVKTAPEPAKSPKKETTPKRRFRFPGFGIPGSSSADYVGKPWIEAPWKVHGTKSHRSFKEGVESGTEIRKKIYDMPIGGERKETSYVGRPNDDVKGTSQKLSRQAQYKIKIIDENKKLAGIVKEAVKEKKEILDKPTKVFDYGKGDLIVINPDTKKNSLDIKDQ